MEAGLLRRRSLARLQPEGIKRAGEIAAALAGSPLGALSELDLLLAEHGDTQGALGLSAANLRWLDNHPAQSAGIRRHYALGIAAHVHLLAGVRETAVDLARTVLTVHPPEERFAHTGLATAITTQSAVHRADRQPDRAAKLLARVPNDQLAHPYRGETRLLDEAALIALDLDLIDAATRLVVTADHVARPSRTAPVAVAGPPDRPDRRHASARHVTALDRRAAPHDGCAVRLTHPVAAMALSAGGPVPSPPRVPTLRCARRRGGRGSRPSPLAQARRRTGP